MTQTTNMRLTDLTISKDHLYMLESLHNQMNFYAWYMATWFVSRDLCHFPCQVAGRSVRHLSPEPSLEMLMAKFQGSQQQKMVININ